MFNSSSPLFIKPSLRVDFLKWVLAFNASCSQKNVAKGIPAIKDICLLGQELYDQFTKRDGFQFQLDKKGLLILCQTEAMLKEEIHVASMAKREGLKVNEISTSDIHSLFPNTEIDALGGVHYHSDWHTTPDTFMENMKSYLVRSGVTI